MNYLKSECYRNLRSRSLMAAGAAMLGICALIIGVLAYFRLIEPEFMGRNTTFALRFLCNCAGAFLYLGVMLAYLIDGNEKKDQTVKHSLSFGVSRQKIYFLRFLDQALVCTVYFGALAGFYFLGSFLLLEHSDAGGWWFYPRMLAGVYPLCMGVLAVTHCFIMNMENTNFSIIPVVCILSVLPQALKLAGMKAPALLKIAAYMPSEMAAAQMGGSSVDFAWDTNGGLGKCWLVGLFWIVCAGICGYLWYRNREIK